LDFVLDPYYAQLFSYILSSFIFSAIRIRFLLNSHVCRIPHFSLFVSLNLSRSFSPFPPFFLQRGAVFLWSWGDVLGPPGILHDSCMIGTGFRGWIFTTIVVLNSARYFNLRLRLPDQDDLAIGLDLSRSEFSCAAFAKAVLYRRGGPPQLLVFSVSLCASSILFWRRSA